MMIIITIDNPMNAKIICMPAVYLRVIKEVNPIKIITKESELVDKVDWIVRKLS